VNSKRDGMNYAPVMRDDRKVVEPGSFAFAAVHFDHGHIYGQIAGLAAAGAHLKYVFDEDPRRYAQVLRDHPRARVARSLEEILDDPEVRLVTAAAIPSRRCALGLRVMAAEKDYFTDKCPFTSLGQLEEARAATVATGRKYMVFYSERLANEAAYHAGELIAEGAIGRVLQVLNLAPHNLAASSRPAWFFQKEHFGGILTDIGSHQFEQFLHYTGDVDGTVNFARVENLDHPPYPEFEDFGEASLTLASGASAYCRLDWFNPLGAKVWGDGRTFVLGTKGYLEVRKYRDLGHDLSDLIHLVDEVGEHRVECAGRIGFPFFGDLLLDCLHRTEKAMTQAHAFKAAELSLRAQAMADAGRSR
jgi:predicted dehydrogenase